MFRRIGAILWLLSLILFLTTAWAWWDSYEHDRTVTYVHEDDYIYFMGSDRGGLYVTEIVIFPYVMQCFPPTTGWHFTCQQANARNVSEPYGGTINRWKPIRFFDEKGSDAEIRSLVTPHWFVMLLLGIWP